MPTNANIWRERDGTATLIGKDVPSGFAPSDVQSGDRFYVLPPGEAPVGPGSPRLPLLDAFPGAQAAYALRPLRANYSGPAVRVRRSSDNTEQDFTASEVGDGTLASFLSGANGFVTTLYDQSGNGRDATQTVASNQPRMRQDAGGRWYVDVEENADTLTAVGFQPTSYVEAYSLPSIGGAAILSEGASGDYAVERPFESWIVYPDTTSQQTKEAIAARLQTEAMGYANATVTSLREHFRDQYILLASSAGVENWDTSSVTDISVMFFYTSVSDLSPLSGWDTSSVTNMRAMFQGTSVSDLSPLSEWDTSSVTKMGSMFFDTSVSDLSPLSEWDTSSVTDMRNMFRGTSVSDLSPLSGWDTSQVTIMRAMFFDTSVSDLSPLSGWDTSSVTNMAFMFLNTSVSDPSTISGWDVASVTNFTSFLEGAPLDSAKTGDMLAGWIDGSPNTASDMKSGVTLGIQNADYINMDTGGQDAVDALCSDPPNWTINATNAPANCS